MSFALDPNVVASIKSFVDLLKKHPDMLESPELAFLKDYLLSLGAKVKIFWSILKIEIESMNQLYNYLLCSLAKLKDTYTNGQSTSRE